MSLIGPRPLLKDDLDQILLNNLSEYLERSKINLKPGITGYWQIYGNRELGVNNLIKMDKIYYENLSFSLDVKIILKTITTLLSANHSDSITSSKKTKTKLNFVYD